MVPGHPRHHSGSATALLLVKQRLVVLHMEEGTATAENFVCVRLCQLCTDIYYENWQFIID